MKRLHISNLSALVTLSAVVLLAGCATDELPELEPGEGGAISFGSRTEAMTRADKVGSDAAALLGNNFVVKGAKGRGSDHILVFDHYNVNWKDNSAGSTTTNTSNWEYAGEAMNPLSHATEQSIKYWDFGASHYDFVAVSKGTGNAVLSTINTENIKKENTTDPVYTLTGSLEDLNKVYVADLVSMEKGEYGTGPVTPRFHGIGSRIRLGLYETVPGYSVKDVKFYASDEDAASDDVPCLFTDSETLPSSASNGTLSVFFPDDNGRSHIKYAAGGDVTLSKKITFDALTYNSDKEKDEEKAAGTTGTKFLGRASNNASFAGGDDAADDNAYMGVIHSGGGTPLNLKVDYKLVPIDGTGDTYDIEGVSAQIPAEYTNWQAGYAYTYLFKITEKTSGLSPITFDAVVINDGGGSQETVTTVSETTITTYQNGHAITQSNQYDADPIYVAVKDDVDNDGEYETVQLRVGNSTGSNISLFVATPLNDATSEDITETLARMCYESEVSSTLDAYGPYRYAGNKFVVLHRLDDQFSRVDSIPASASPFGSTLEIKGATFTPTPDEKYVIQYRGPHGTQYKVLNVTDKAVNYINYTALEGDIYYYLFSEEYDWYCGVLENLNNCGAAFYDENDDEVSLIEEDSKASSYRGNDGLIHGTLYFEKPVFKIYGAFDLTSNLVSIQLPPTLEETIDFNNDDYITFMGSCFSLSSIIIPKSVKRLGTHAFDCNYLNTVVLNEGLEEIGGRAFSDSENLDNVFFPSTVKKIGESAFRNSRYLSNIKLNEGLETIESGAFYGCNLQSVEIPASVIMIGDDGFANIINLKTITFAKYACEIGSQCFDNCQNLEEVLVDESKINPEMADEDVSFGGSRGSVFGNCYNLKRVTLPENVSSLCGNLFGGNDQLNTSLILLRTKSVVEIENTSFNDGQANYTCPSGLKVYVPQEMLDQYLEDTNWKEVNKYALDTYGHPLLYAITE